MRAGLQRPSLVVMQLRMAWSECAMREGYLLYILLNQQSRHGLYLLLSILPHTLSHSAPAPLTLPTSTLASTPILPQIQLPIWSPTVTPIRCHSLHYYQRIHIMSPKRKLRRRPDTETFYNHLYYTYLIRILRRAYHIKAHHLILCKTVSTTGAQTR